MNALLKQLIQLGMPENNGFGASLTDKQMAQWLFAYTQERNAEKANSDFFRAQVAAALAELRAELVANANAMATHGSGASACTIQDAFDATIAALGLADDAFDALIASRPDALEMLADEAEREKRQ